MSDLSIEQAALAAGRTDWRARARREAAAILEEVTLTVPRTDVSHAMTCDRDTLLGLLAIAWLQGVNLGSHETLHMAEQAFDRLRDEL